ncbi:MAG: hypothetical protein HOC23_22980 [Halieaceae bacterium]|jgi:hypothetical protein|nr:hypothetical protein [Halieaceae bacterium]
MGEFPSGEFPGSEAEATGEAGTSGSAEEPGFGGYAAGEGQALPDLTDEPSLEDTMEGGMGDAQSSAGEPGETTGSGTVAGTQGDASAGGDGNASAGAPPAGTGRTASGGMGLPGQESTGESGASSGPLTPAEQVAILDAQLERGAGVFDGIIREEASAQRRAARESTANQSLPTEDDPQGEYGEYDGGMADGGTYSSGGGIGGGASTGESTAIPRDTAKYPAPAGIPDGNDDDVVARQLREAAMREPDPAVREKLWDEYRKYKGLD